MKTTDRRLQRLFRLLSLIRCDSRGVAHCFSEMLGVSKRTVFRDIATLRACGIFIGYDTETLEYFTVESEKCHFRLNAEEVGSLLSLISTSAVGDPVLRRAVDVVHKIAATLSDSEQRIARLYQASCVVSGDCEQLSSEEARLLVAVQNSAIRKRAVRLVIRSQDRRTLFKPFAVARWNGKWYAVGRSSIHRRTVVLRISDMHSLEFTEDAFSVPARFQVELQFRNKAWIREIIANDS